MMLYFVDLPPALAWDRKPRDEPYATLEAAHEDACAAAKQIVADALKSGATLREALNRSFEITNDSGALEMVVSFAEAVETNAKP